MGIQCVCVESNWEPKFSPGSLNSMMITSVLVDQLLEGRDHLTQNYSFLSTGPAT